MKRIAIIFSILGFYALSIKQADANTYLSAGDVPPPNHAEWN